MRKLFALVAAFRPGQLGVALALPRAAGGDGQVKAAVAIAAGVAVAIAAFGAALGQGRVGAAAMESIGRNPNAAEKLFLPLVIDSGAARSFGALRLRHRDLTAR